MAFWNTITSTTTSTGPSKPETKPETPAEAAPAKVPQSPTAPAQPPPVREKENPMSMKREDAPLSAGGPSDLLLGQGAEFEGKLTFAGTVRIDAKFKGSIVTNDVLVVGEHARIDADITCGTVIVHGEVNGNIKAKTAVELHRPARVRGNVETPSLMLEKGVVFEGESRMGQQEKAGTARSAPALSSATAAAPAVG
jgi:cytoskeletal protein CcmA (bactofilin family)